jgi:hypothetical protein
LLDRTAAHALAGRYFSDELFDAAVDKEGRVTRVAFSREVRKIQVINLFSLIHLLILVSIL